MNNVTVDYSFDSSFEKQYLTNTQRFTLIVISSILLIGNVFSNALVTYLLVKAKPFLNYSMKLMLLLSTSDILTAATVRTIQILSLSVPLEIICSVSVLEPRFTAVMPRISLYHYLNNRFGSVHPYTICSKISNSFNITSCLHFDDWSLCLECC